MKVTLDREGKNVVKLDFEVASDKALKEYEISCRQISQQINIPGFRKGKAPRNILEKTVGVDAIKRETLERLVPKLFSQAIVDENLDPITNYEVDAITFDLGQPLNVKLKCEVRPEVELGQYTGLAVEVGQANLPEDAMERALNNIAGSRASLATIDPRPVQMGDTVLLDFECRVDGKIIDGGKAQGLLLEVKEGSFVEGFCPQLVGKEPGQQFEVNVRFPDSYRNAELAGKDANFNVDLKEIRERTVPDINDELAKVVGHESLDELKGVLQQHLEQEIKQENDGRAQKKVIEAVIALAKVDIPETMIERERDLLITQLKQMFEQNKEDFEAFKNSPEFASVLKAKFEEARQRVLTTLVLGAIVRAERMTVSDEEVAPYLVELMQQYNVPIDQIARNPQLRRDLIEQVLTNKVVQFLLASSEITYVDEPEHVHGENCSHDEHKHGDEHVHGENCSHDEHKHGDEHVHGENCSHDDAKSESKPEAKAEEKAEEKPEAAKAESGGKKSKG